MNEQQIIDKCGEAMLARECTLSGTSVSMFQSWRDAGEMQPRTGMRTDAGIALKRAGFAVGDEREFLKKIDAYANDVGSDEENRKTYGPKISLVQDVKALLYAVMTEAKGTASRAYFPIPRPGDDSEEMALLVKKTTQLAQELGLKQLPPRSPGI